MGFLCCSVLQWVAVSGSEWQWVAVSGSEWQCVAVCCSVLQCVTGCYSTLQSVAVYGSVWQCMAVCCNHQAVFVHKSALGGQSVPQNTCTNSQLSKKNRQQLFQIRNKSGQYTTENRYKGGFWESLPAISVDAPPASYSKFSKPHSPVQCTVYYNYTADFWEIYLPHLPIHMHITQILKWSRSLFNVPLKPPMKPIVAHIYLLRLPICRLDFSKILKNLTLYSM